MTAIRSVHVMIRAAVLVFELQIEVTKICGVFCAADEPTLRDNDALRSKAIIPMVILCVSFSFYFERIVFDSKLYMVVFT